MLAFKQEQFLTNFADYNTAMWPAQVAARLLGVVMLAALGLTGCAMYFDYPSVAEAPMTVGERKVVIESLVCGADGRVIAAGHADSLTSFEGMVLYSSDRGSTWLQAALEPRAVSISLSTVEWPAGPEKGSTFVSGYRLGENLLSGISRSSYPPGPWWSSADGGRSWRSTTARMLLPPTSDIGLGIPEPVVADAAGTLVATADDRGGPLALLRSTDGGATWQRQSFPQLSHYGSIVSDGLGRLALSGRSRRDTGVVYWSADSGATWSESDISTGGKFPFKAPAALRLYRSPAGALIAFNSDSLGKGRSPAWVFSSADNGRSWSFAQGFERVGRIVGLGLDRERRIVAITEWGHVLRGDGRGTTWALANETIPVETSTAVSQAIFGPGGVVLAVHYRGGIFRSTDDGRTWRRVDSGLPDRQFDLNRHCVDGMGLVVVAGSGGMLTRSTDWGATWQPGRIVGTTASSAARPTSTVIQCRKDGDAHRAVVEKQKDGQDNIPLPFALDQVELGEDEDGEPITSCVVVHDHDGKARPLTGWTATAVKVLRQLKQSGMATGGNLATEIPLIAYHNHWYQERPADKKDTVRKNARRQLETLREKKLLEWNGGESPIRLLPTFNGVTIELE